MDTNKSLPSIGTLFSWAWEKYREGFWKYIGFTALIGVLMFVAMGAASIIAIFGTIGLGGKGLIIAIPAVIIGAVIMVMLISALQLFIPYSIFSGSSFKEAFKWSIKNSLPAVWIGIIFGVILLGGYALFFIPAIILAFIFFAAKYVFIEEGKKGFEALAKSKDYTTGFFWEILMRFLAIGFGFGVIMAGWGLILLTTTLISPILGGLASIGFGLFTFAVMPLVYILGYGVFKQLKEAKSELKDLPAAKDSKMLPIGFFVWGSVVFIGLVLAFSLVAAFFTRYTTGPWTMPASSSYSKELPGFGSGKYDFNSRYDRDGFGDYKYNYDYNPN